MSYESPGSFYVPNYADWIHTNSHEAVGAFTKAGGIASGATSQTWTAANTAILVPFVMDRPRTAVAMFYWGGSAGGDNFDVGIYAEDGTLLVSLGGAAGGGTSQEHVDITDTPLPVGRYYMALVRDGTTANNCGGATPAAALCAAMGICQIASNYPLANGTPAITTQALVPSVGVMFRTTAL